VGVPNEGTIRHNYLSRCRLHPGQASLLRGRKWSILGSVDVLKRPRFLRGTSSILVAAGATDYVAFILDCAATDRVRENAMNQLTVLIPTPNDEDRSVLRRTTYPNDLG